MLTPAGMIVAFLKVRNVPQQYYSKNVRFEEIFKVVRMMVILKPKSWQLPTKLHGAIIQNNITTAANLFIRNFTALAWKLIVP
jgi:hypothetical protein